MRPHHLRALRSTARQPPALLRRPSSTTTTARPLPLACRLPFASSSSSRAAAAAAPPTRQRPSQQPRHQLHASAARHGVMPPPAPEDADKEGNTTPAGEPKAVQPAEISYEEYHELADGFLEELQGKLEEVQERSEGLEVEFAAGVLTIDTQQGTYVINKQPPNKQIWLSSPLTGPKRYDWVVQGESMHEKEGGGVGGWIYLRDGSSLAQLLKKELNINVERDE